MKTRGYRIDGRRPGLTLWQIIALILAGALIFTIALYCVGLGSSMSTAINAQSITLTPSKSTVAYGSTGTFTVTVTFAQAYDRTKDTNFAIYIYEDDFWGDTLLEDTVVVTVPRNQTSGSTQFTLDCTLGGSIMGSVGSRYQRIADYDVYAQLRPIPDGVREKKSDNVEVECRKE